VSLDEALRMVMEGEATDAVTVAAILKLHYSGLVRRRVPILYQDSRCVIVDKPADLLVHRVDMSRDRHYLLQIVRDQIGMKVYPAHRLDRPTAGLLLFATDQEAASVFGQLLAGGGVEKKYWALVRGHTDDEGVIDSPLAEAGRELAALTLYRTLWRVELPIAVGPYGSSRYSLVEVDLKTGRTHQIRRHFCRIGHPVVGDSAHGDGRHNRSFRENFACHRLFLAARSLRFTHPFTGEAVFVEAPLDRELRGVLDRVRNYGEESAANGV
jgi:tRNA pseudouridine65 synthase